MRSLPHMEKRGKAKGTSNKPNIKEGIRGEAMLTDSELSVTGNRYVLFSPTQHRTNQGDHKDKKDEGNRTARQSKVKFRASSLCPRSAIDQGRSLLDSFLAEVGRAW